MLKSLKIENFRRFESFEIKDLGRINLLVGTNNCGKTSILEAIDILFSRDNLEPLYRFADARGEYFWKVREPMLSLRPPEEVRRIEIRHFFYGRSLELGSQFSILGKNEKDEERLVASILESRDDGDDEQVESYEDIDSNRELGLGLKWTGRDYEYERRVGLSSSGRILRYIRRPGEKLSGKEKSINTQFVTSFSLDKEELIALFDEVVLTDEETDLLKALQTIEPTIEKIAVANSARYVSRRLPARGGFLVRCSDDKQRIPIGSMGDGIWRMLGLALAIIGARGGVLLVDDIDTGFHYSVMSDMWKMLWTTAKKLDVQVFATTHNKDCWESLASIVEDESSDRDRITIQRIERDKKTAVTFSDSEIEIAAEENIEVR